MSGESTAIVMGYPQYIEWVKFQLQTLQASAAFVEAYSKAFVKEVAAGKASLEASRDALVEAYKAEALKYRQYIENSTGLASEEWRAAAARAAEDAYGRAADLESGIGSVDQQIAEYVARYEGIDLSTSTMGGEVRLEANIKCWSNWRCDPDRVGCL